MPPIVDLRWEDIAGGRWFTADTALNRLPKIEHVHALLNVVSIVVICYDLCITLCTVT